jgi:regulatory protein
VARASQKLSLKGRAIALLARREHSSTELRRKLLRIARERDAAAAASDSESGESPPKAAPEDEDAAALGTQARIEEVDTLLAWLQAQGYLSETRFVESRIHARAARHGNLRIRQELAQHGLAPDADQLERLKESEFDRARAIWQRKFGNSSPETTREPAERARQMRFLAGRGFSADVIRRLLRYSGGDGE